MSMSIGPSLVWFKPTDLRLLDHPALFTAHSHSSHVEHCFVYDPRWVQPSRYDTTRMGFKRAKFLCESVKDLHDRLQQRGSRLLVVVGQPETAIPAIARVLQATKVYSTCEVADEEARVTVRVEEALRSLGIQSSTHWGGTMFEPEDLPFEPQGMPVIYTQFRKSVERDARMKPPLPEPTLQPCLGGVDESALEGVDVPPQEVRFNPLHIWPSLTQIEETTSDPRTVLQFQGGETLALARMQEYIWDKDLLRVYKETRNGMVGGDYSSKFSPWLALGCLSPRTIMQEVKRYEEERVANESTYWLFFELLWRDYFRYYVIRYGARVFKLYGPQLLRTKRWGYDPRLIEAWKAGRTGYPFIDANMRELASTGFMSNRGRQVVVSFLTRDMGQDWRYGAYHFEQHLLDYDPGSNWGNWAYGAGVGCDPREDRYFNVVKQAKVYDPDGEYIRLWCPEVAHIPTPLLQDPQHLLHTRVPEYPAPIVPLIHGSYTKQTPAKVPGFRSNGGNQPSNRQKNRVQR